MKTIRTIMLALATLLITSCDKSELPTQRLGETSYYPSFLFWDADTTSLTKVIELDFNADAKAEGTSTTAEFEFVDNDGNRVSTDCLEIKVNGVVSENNCFTVNASQTEVELVFTFLPEAESGKHQGNLRMISHNLLDRVDNQIVEGSQPIDIFKWTIYFEKNWNPLFAVLFWLTVILVSAFLLWKVVICPMVYPRFGSIQKTFTAPGMAPLIVRFKGNRMVVISATPQKKQSGWNSFWTGKILYKNHPAFVTPVSFKPSRGRRILAKVPAGSYQVLPNPMPGVGTATIVDMKRNLKINVN